MSGLGPTDLAKPALGEAKSEASGYPSGKGQWQAT